MSVPKPLGGLSHIRIWHDNSGRGDAASWYLDRIIVRDTQTDEVYVFLCNQWLAIDQEDGSLERTLVSASREDLANFQYIFYSKTRQDMSDGHLWFSLISRPTRSHFTRVQRLSCCLALLFMTMIANAMWYKTEDTVESPRNVHLGPFTFTPQQLFISLASSVVSIPVSVLIIFLFRKSRPKTKKRQPFENGTDTSPLDRGLAATPSIIHVDGMDSQSSPRFMGQELDMLISEGERSPTPKLVTRQDGPPSPTKPKKKVFSFPHWCVYIAWILVILSVALSGFFTLLFSFEWGKEKSSQWLTTFLLSFLQSVFLIQPIKVCIPHLWSIQTSKIGWMALCTAGDWVCCRGGLNLEITQRSRGRIWTWRWGGRFPGQNGHQTPQQTRIICSSWWESIYF